MEKHITFEELQKFVFAEALTPDMIQLGSRINAHVLSCEECAKQYNAMLEMQQTSEAIYRSKMDELLGLKTESVLQSERDLIEQQMEGPKGSSGDAGREKSREQSRGIGH